MFTLSPRFWGNGHMSGVVEASATPADVFWNVLSSQSDRISWTSHTSQTPGASDPRPPHLLFCSQRPSCEHVWYCSKHGCTCPRQHCSSRCHAQAVRQQMLSTRSMMLRDLTSGQIKSPPAKKVFTLSEWEHWENWGVFFSQSRCLMLSCCVML